MNLFKKKKNVTVQKDFGKVTVPEKWDDITLKQFQELMKLIQYNMDNGYPNDTADILAILTGKTREYINSLPAQFIDSIAARMSFVARQLDVEPQGSIEIGGETYRVNIMEKLKFGEWTDVNMTFKADDKNYAAAIAILCRKDGEEYNDDFIANKLDDRIRMFEEMPVTKAMPIAAFFLGLWATSAERSKEYFRQVSQSAIQCVQTTENFLKHGDGRKSNMIWRWRTLRKLRKYRKAISLLSCPT